MNWPMNRTVNRTSLALALVTAAGLSVVPAALAQDAPTAPASAPSLAGDTAPAAEIDANERKVTGFFSVYGGHVFSHDLDDAGGVSITRAGAKAGVTFPVGKDNAWTLSFGGEGSWYDFADATGFGAGITEPWDDVRILTVETSYAATVNDRWQLIMGLGVESGMEENAEFEDSLTVTGLLGVNYQVSDTLSLGLGLYGGTRLEDDAFILPIPFINWQINDQWSLGSRPSTRGGRFALTYKASDAWSAFAFAAFESREFRLDDDASGPAPEGVGRDRRIPVGLGVSWTPNKQIALEVVAGADVWSEYTLDDRDGNEIGEQDGDLAPFIGAQVSLRF